MTKGRHVELVNDLEKKIITGKLLPGSRIDEISIAKEYNVSRTPVREALMQLNASGLIDLRPGKSATVASIDLKAMLQMFEVMSELEGMCGRLAARRANDDELKALQEIHKKSKKAVQKHDLEGYYELNVQLHETIYAACRNDFLIQQTTTLRNRLAAYRRGQLLSGNRIEQSFAEHSKIIESIIARDAEEADKLLFNHVMIQSGTINDFIATLPATM